MFTLKRNQWLYILDVFLLSILIFLFLACFFNTTDNTISYLLSLIASTSIINGLKNNIT